jgi:hypothetical protein
MYGHFEGLIKVHPHSTDEIRKSVSPHLISMLSPRGSCPPLPFQFHDQCLLSLWSGMAASFFDIILYPFTLHQLRTTGLRLPQTAFRDLDHGRKVQPFNGSWQRDEGGLLQEHVNGRVFLAVIGPVLTSLIKHTRTYPNDFVRIRAVIYFGMRRQGIFGVDVSIGYNGAFYSYIIYFYRLMRILICFERKNKSRIHFFQCMINTITNSNIQYISIALSCIVRLYPCYCIKTQQHQCKK